MANSKIEEYKRTMHITKEMTKEFFREGLKIVNTATQEEKDEIFDNMDELTEAFNLYNEGIALLEKKKYKEAFTMFSKCHEIDPGIPCNNARLGACYYYGLGTNQSYRKAISYLKECIGFSNDNYGLYMYGKCLYEGNGIKKNIFKGIEFIEIAGLRNVKDAIVDLIDIYHDDEEVKAFWENKLEDLLEKEAKKTLNEK